MSGAPSKRRPYGPVRQLSLQASTSPPVYNVGGASLASRRHQLRKQSSEDVWHSGGTLGVFANSIHQLGGGAPSSARPVSKHRPPPVRLAWAEQRSRQPAGAQQGEAPSDPPKVEVEVVARKCTMPQHRTRPPPKPVTQEALDGSRLRLAERLRLAWQQSAPTRTNLDIFLAHNSNVNANATSNPTSPTAASPHPQVIATPNNHEHSSSTVTAQNQFVIEVEGKEEAENGLIAGSGSVKSRTEEGRRCGEEEGNKHNVICNNGMSIKMEQGKQIKEEQKSICISITDSSRNISRLDDQGEEEEEDDDNDNENQAVEARRFGGRRDFEDDDDDDGLEVEVQQRSKVKKNGVVKGGILRPMTSAPDLLVSKKSENVSTTPSASRSSTPGGSGRQDPLGARRLMSAPPQSLQRRLPSQQQGSAVVVQQPDRTSPPSQQVRRKLKSARRKQQRPQGDEEDISSGEESIEQKPRRSRSARTSEVITMVSLLSPGQSEQEEEDCGVAVVLGATTVVIGDQHAVWQETCTANKVDATGGKSCTTNGNLATGGGNSPFINGASTSNPILCIRKPVKTVSFQQQAGAKSYANNFPSRRGAAILPEEANNPAPPVLRSTSLVAANSLKEANPVLKRKLVRARSSNEPAVSPVMLNEEDDESEKQPAQISVEVKPIKIISTTRNLTNEDNKNNNGTFSDSKQRNKMDDRNETDNGKEENETDDVPEFKTPKEQECWDLFRRMVDKGITVSFETVLRGMLTPTEYRLRRHNLLTS